METPIRQGVHGCIIEVYVSPRASKSRVIGRHGDRLKVQIAAPPVDGKANDALVALVANWLSVPKSSVTILSGSTGKQKTIEVLDVKSQHVQQLIDLIDSGRHHKP
ncbi:MAG: YggU family protein [Myxococcales bacterium]|nr:YggU family protein [Myxococcales bacterium]